MAKKPAKAKPNISVVPMLLRKNFVGAFRMLRGFMKMEICRRKKRQFENYDHMKNFALIYLKLTPVCNLKCVMCGQRGDKGYLKGEVGVQESKKILPLEQYKKLADELSTVRPVYYLWGGEPFLYPDLIPLVKYLKSKKSFVSINTNGTMLEKFAEQIVDAGPDVIFVSLDAFRDINDEIRGKGSYDKVVAGFKAINEAKIKLNKKAPLMGVVTTVTNKNYKVLADLAEACKDFKIDVHIYNLGTYTNDKIVAEQKKHMKEKLDTDIDCLEAYNTGYNKGINGQECYDILNKIHSTDYGYLSITVPALNPEKIDEYYGNLEIPVRDHCIVPWCQCDINYNGDVHFCADYTDYVIGNITEQSFKDIFNGERANKFRHAIHESKDGMFPGCIRCYQNMLCGQKRKGY